MKQGAAWLSCLLVAASLAGCGGGEKGPATPPENYIEKIPGTEIEIEMVYVPAGEFMMGSPDGEQGREEDEGPVRKVKVGPFWIGKTEVTWDQFEQYAFVKDPTMIDAVTLPSLKLNPTWMRLGVKWIRQRVEVRMSDSLETITRPSNYYGDYYHGMGRGKKPAIGMSWLGAMVYCDWLSKKTGHQYRLPTEAEWEYAARAGSQTAWCFGDDQSQLGDYAWHVDNSDWETAEVGLKQPNAFGIHDMHGNVWEFTIDGYDPDYLKQLGDGVNQNPEGIELELGPIRGPLKPTLRGGSWDDELVESRSANRQEQLDWWNERDPQRPRGSWWLIDGNVVGFRLIRSAD